LFRQVGFPCARQSKLRKDQLDACKSKLKHHLYKTGGLSEVEHN